MQALASTGDAPLPAPWSEGRTGQGRKIYFAAIEDGGQVSTGSRLDAINASDHVEEHPETSIEDALKTAVARRVALECFEVVGARVENAAPHALDATLSRFPTRWLMSTQDVNNQGHWTHTYDVFPPIRDHKQASAFSAALVAAGKLGAPADDPLVAELYHETVGVHVAALVAAKKVDGLELVVDEHTFYRLCRWTHGDIIVTTEDNARKFSAALKSRGLSKAPPGHWLVRALHRELFASDREKAIAKMKMPGLELEVADLHKHRYTWRHGELFVTTETQARTFSAALQRRGLLEARAGDSRVQSTARK